MSDSHQPVASVWPLLAVTFLLLPMILRSQSGELPFTVDPLYDFSTPQTLGLSSIPGTETFTIFLSGPNDNHYNHGVVLFPYRGYLYGQWQSSARDEDAPDTRVVYSRSADGVSWIPPITLALSSDTCLVTNGGWWSDGKVLIGFLNIWKMREGPKEGFTYYISTEDGISWTTPKPVLDKNRQPIPGVIEQDPHQLGDGRIFTAFHLQPGLVATPFYTDDPTGISGWTRGNMPGMPVTNSISRGIEPSLFVRTDNAIVMIFRDQESSFGKMATVSTDRGVNWSAPVLVDAPDSRAKQSAGNLPNGIAYMVNNPSGNKDRFPLAITLSMDGFTFDKAFLLRAGGDDLQPIRYEGKFKRPGYSYPKSVVWGDYLYVGYATNKEDIQLTRVPLSNLGR